MTASFEVVRKARDFRLFRALAAELLNLEHTDWTEWELDWLAVMASKPESYVASDRECEKLAQINSYSEACSGHDGLTVEQMVKGCHRYHLDFAEADSDFIVELRQRDARIVRKRQLRRLVRLYAEVAETTAAAWEEEPA